MSIITFKNADLLPSEYQEVEYIGSTGTQYIDTGVKLLNSDIVKCKFSITSLPDTSRGIYGSGTSAAGFFNLLIRNPITARVGGGSNQTTSGDLVLDHIYETTLTSGTYIEDRTTYTFTGGNCDGTLNCFVFARNSPSYTTPIPSKIYSFEIEGKFKGIPCYRKADGVIGLYDTVSETFFTNAGTGVFTKGNDVSGGGFNIQENEIVLFQYTSRLPDAYQEVEYIEST